jgi:hypothetical protein
MVVALHLEDDRKTIANRDDASVLPGSLDYPGSRDRQLLEVDFGGLVRAVLVPHRGENPKLGQGRFATNEHEDPLVFLRR